MDRITEAIAHFIGLFEITNEEARQRESYTEFAAEKAEAPEILDHPLITSSFVAPYTLQDFIPDVDHSAPGPYYLMHGVLSSVVFNPPRIPDGDPLSLFVYPGHINLPGSFAVGSSHTIVLPQVEVIGSVATYLSQQIGLSDDDYFGVGGSGLFFNPEPVGDGPLLSLAAQAALLSPIDDLEMPGSADALREFVTTASARLEAFDQADVGDADEVVHKAPTLEGTFVNGEKVDEAPKFEDYHQFDDPVEEDTSSEEDTHFAKGAQTKFSDPGSPGTPSVKVETGGNTLVNDAVVHSFWTAAPVMAVVGKHIELNAIFQINAWCDNDSLSSAVGDWFKDPAETQAFNIASFKRFDTSDDEDSAQDAGAESFPQHWVVEKIDGDLMIVNWLQQFTFMTDNDIGVISSSGVTTTVSTGDNFAVNGTSIYELGFAYDLIIIGGGVYDANIIHQLNILCDNDLIGAVEGFETSGSGSVSTSDNLLWNQANIFNVAGADSFEQLPDHYLATAQALAAGGDGLSDLVLSDSAFAGFGPLKVLYITGDVLKVNYVKQTTMLGDSDQVALAMHALDPSPDAEWSVSTGGNVLVNNASINALDSLGKTYVGDGHYSNDVLVQADIISTDPYYGMQDPNQLVNEAVAFLDDEMAGQDDGPAHGPYGQFDDDGQHGDGLQTMLG